VEAVEAYHLVVYVVYVGTRLVELLVVAYPYSSILESEVE
jgi:hypothetical protein